jgi:hypothetical protein
MAAKDIDLATDYAERSLFLVDEDTATFEIEVLQVNQEAAIPELFVVELGVGGGAAGPVYRMRAHDTTLGRYVYWQSSSVDSAGANYAGPGPLTDVVVQNVIGAG